MDLNGFSTVEKDPAQKREIEDAIRSLFKTHEGKIVFKYFLKEFKVGELPPIGFEGALLHEYIGFCRSGSSMFETLANICPHEAALVLAEIYRENKNV